MVVAEVLASLDKIELHWKYAHDAGWIPKICSPEGIGMNQLSSMYIEISLSSKPPNNSFLSGFSALASFVHILETF